MMKKIIIVGISLILFFSIAQANTRLPLKEDISFPILPEIKVVKEDLSGIIASINQNLT